MRISRYHNYVENKSFTQLVVQEEFEDAKGVIRIRIYICRVHVSCHHTKISQKKIITCTKALILIYSFLLDTRDIFSVVLFVFFFTNVPGVLFREICNSVFMCTLKKVSRQTTTIAHMTLWV